MADTHNMLVIAQHLHKTYFGPGALDWPPGQNLQFLATNYLKDQGFERVEWAQAEDDVLLCLLWMPTFFNRPRMQEWIIEFLGPDASIITVFSPVATMEL